MMGLFEKKQKNEESKATRVFRIFLWKLFKKTRFRERIARANQWAEQHKGRTAAMTIGSLLVMLVIGSLMTFTEENEPQGNVIDGIAVVNPMFQRLQRIQNNKAYQLSQMESLTMRGKALKHELDSLIRIPLKSHDDSLQIIIKHRQLELIVNNLENR